MIQIFTENRQFVVKTAVVSDHGVCFLWFPQLSLESWLKSRFEVVSAFRLREHGIPVNQKSLPNRIVGDARPRASGASRSAAGAAAACVFTNSM